MTESAGHDAIAISWGWFKGKRGWYHPNAEQYHGHTGFPVCYETSKELCEAENLTTPPQSGPTAKTAAR